MNRLKLNKVKKINFKAIDIGSFPHTYWCKICGANHYFNSEIGREHLPKNQKRLEGFKVPEKKAEYLTPKQKVLLKVEELKKAKKILKELNKIDFTIIERPDLTFDTIDFKEFKNISNDFNVQDFSVLHGPITRSGAFPYNLGGYKVTLYKQWDNLKDVFSKLDYIPLIGSAELGAHYAKTLGFAYNFTFDDNHERVYADVITLEDMDKLSNNYQPEREGWEVSIGFKDRRIGQKQIIDGVDHLAVSLRNKEMGRCRYGGDPCYINKKAQDQNLRQMEVVSYNRN